MEKIILGGMTYRIGFDFSTLLAVEETFNTDFSTFIGSTERSMRDNLRFLYACLAAFNPDMDDFTEWLHSVSTDDIKALNTAIVKAQGEFFHTPDIAISHLPELTEEEKETARKNA